MFISCIYKLGGVYLLYILFFYGGIEMRIKDDSYLRQLTMFGFRCVEQTSEGFLRYSKRIGNLVVTVANGQFEHKIRLSMLMDQEGRIRTTHLDLMKYTDLIGALVKEGFILNEVVELEPIEGKEEYHMEENPLISFPMKPEGFMEEMKKD